MINTVWAVVREGKVVPLEEIKVPEGTRALITLLPEEGESDFWLAVSALSSQAVWENEEDNVYAKLLEE